MPRYPAVLHCYVRPENAHYIAVCLELDLVDQGTTLENAKTALEENIVGYLGALTPENIDNLFPRPAPLYIYLDYYRVRGLILLSKIIRSLKTRWIVFAEPLLLRPQLLYG